MTENVEFLEFPKMPRLFFDIKKLCVSLPNGNYKNMQHL